MGIHWKKTLIYSKVFYTILIATLAASLIFLAAPSVAQQNTPSFGTSGLSGESSSKPTSLQFGPDDRLYVAQQDGTIKAYTVERNGKNQYAVTNTETINNIKQIPNHNDDGTTDSTTPTNERQVTGILVKGTAQTPVIYVTSSDPRIGAGTNKGDVNLDTNSGVISKLTKTTSGWNKVDLVRGLPRSEENHSQNGLQLSGGKLYVTSGGNTNQGAPSNNFALLPEYALSAAILEVDLAAIGNTTYDLPTIGSSPNQPFGGNDGENQAKLVSGGPVQVYSPGYRNAYDLVIAESGKMYTVDNGGNSGWGDKPKGVNTPNCTNDVSEPGQTNADQLHFINGKGYYGGHPNPTRGNPSGSGFSGAVPAANPVECNYNKPGAALTTFPASTNGLTEYTASNFGGAMKGDLLTTSYNGKIYRLQLNNNGEGLAQKSELFSGFGSVPLDVTAQGDNDAFPGTVWSAVYFSNTIQVFEPDDFGGGGGTTCDTSDPNGDADGDGFTNADEVANNTDPCSAGSKPDDADGDGISDKTDPDDDNDGLNDKVDPFARDAQNGKTTDLPVSLTFENETGGTSPGGILDLGFTGLMTNGTSDYQNLYDPENVIAGGAAGVFTVEEVTDGDAYKANNTQEYGFQFGVNAAGETQPFTAHTQISAPFAGITPQNYQSMGMYIGTGDQDNFLKIVTTANSGKGGIEVLKESGGTPSGKVYGPGAGVNILGSDEVDLYLTVDPANSTVQPSYSINGGQKKDLGAPIAVPQSWLGPQALAVGVISTSTGPAPTFAATWKFIQITSGGNPSEPTEPTPTEPDPDNVVHRVNAGGPQLTGGTPPWSPDTKANPSPYVNAVETGNNTFSTTSQIDTTNVPGYVPMKLFQTERWDPAPQPEMQWNFPVEPGEYEVRLYFAEIFDGAASDDARLFDVDVEVEGNTVLNDYDVFENAGGANKAVMEPINVTVTDNNLDVNFLHVKENPTIKGIEVLKKSGSPTPPSTGQAQVQITPTGGLNASTYSNGSFKIQNDSADGQKIQSVNIDLSTAMLPDMVFDPNGTAGDATAKCFTANSGASVVGLATQNGACGSPPFSKPHDGKVEDGYDALNIDFNDFGPGESFAFSVDVDPTSIKGDPDDGGAGSVSGLELTGATVNVVFSDGANYTTQTYRIPASNGGSQAVAKDGNIAKPAISANGSAQAQTVSNPDQTVKVEGPAGGQVSLLVVEAGLFVKSGGGYDIDPYEANSAVKIAEKKNITIGQNGTANVPATLTKSAEKAGLNYIVAVVEKDGRTGPTSNVLVLELGDSAQNAAPVSAADEYQTEQDGTLTVNAPGVLGNDTDADSDALTAKPGQKNVENGTLKLNADGSFTYTPKAGFTGTDTFTYVANDGQADSGEATVTINVNATSPAVNPAAFVAINSGTGINSSTYKPGSFKITNKATEGKINRVVIDLSTAILPDMVFDPVGTAGDKLGKCFEANDGGDAAGLVTDGSGSGAGSCAAPFSKPRDGGYDVITLEFDDFGPGETFTFSVDVDPTSIKGSTETGGPGSVSGLELAGSTVTTTFGGESLTTETYRIPNSNGGSQNTAKAGELAPPKISFPNVSLKPTTLSAEHTAATVSQAGQTVQISGAAGATASLLVLENELNVTGVPNGGFDLEAYEGNSAVKVTEVANKKIGTNGKVSLPVTLTRTNDNAGLNYMVAVVKDSSGRTSANSNVVILKLDPNHAATGSLTASAQQLDFGEVEVGQDKAQQLTLTNTGDSAVKVQSAATTGDNAKSFDHDLNGEVTLEPDESKEVTTTFAPPEPGDKVAKLLVENDGSEPQLEVALAGKGIEPPPASNPDKKAPDTLITRGPSKFTKNSTARFFFKATEANSSFQCKLDKAAFEDCRPGQTYRNLKDGRHVFWVRAIDPAGNVDKSPARQVWTVDRKKPAIFGISPRSKTGDLTPTVRATVRDGQVNLTKSNIKLYVDGRPKGRFSYNPRSDRLSYTTGRLAVKRHTVKIVAVDKAGNRTVKSWTFKVEKKRR